MANKQTAVEWLLSMVSLSEDAWIEIEKYEAKAKQMEKEQIEKAFNKGLITENVYYGYDDKKSEQYYNETYGKDSTE